MSRVLQATKSQAAEPPFHIKGASGSHVWDAQGAKYLDLTSGWNVVNAGWKNKEIGDVWRSSVDTLPFRPAWCVEDSLIALEAFFEDAAPGYSIIPACTGGEAIDNALKVARMVTGRPGVITHAGGYHGSTTGAAFAAGYEVSHLAPLGLEENSILIPTPAGPECLESAEQLVRCAENAGAIVFETVLTNAGCYVTSNEHLTLLSRLAEELGLLLVCDEIGTGINRTGTLLSIEQREIRPDIIVVGKALTNGLYPLSLCLVCTKLTSFLDREAFASTFGGAPLGCAAALATLRYHKANELGVRATEIGATIKRRLSKSLAKCERAKAIHGEGFELAVQIDWYSGASIGLTPYRLLDRLRRKGVFATLSADRDLMVMPPLVANPDDLLNAMDAIAEVLGA